MYLKILISVYGPNYIKMLDIHNSTGACVDIWNSVQVGCLILAELFDFKFNISSSQEMLLLFSWLNLRFLDNKILDGRHVGHDKFEKVNINRNILGNRGDF